MFFQRTDRSFPSRCSSSPCEDKANAQPTSRELLIIKAQRSDYLLSTYYIPGTLNGEPQLVVQQWQEADAIVILVLQKRNETSERLGNLCPRSHSQ